jgi:hypothetical protein
LLRSFHRLPDLLCERSFHSPCTMDTAVGRFPRELMSSTLSLQSDSSRSRVILKTTRILGPVKKTDRRRTLIRGTRYRVPLTSSKNGSSGRTRIHLKKSIEGLTEHGRHSKNVEVPGSSRQCPSS